jgi:hypothetical protein
VVGVRVGKRCVVVAIVDAWDDRVTLLPVLVVSAKTIFWHSVGEDLRIAVS